MERRASPPVQGTLNLRRDAACRVSGSERDGARKTGQAPSLRVSTRGKKQRMATEFKLPELGENIESGDLVRLMIKPGASITEGEPVMELETDKAVVEVPSSVTGTIGEVRVKEGDKLRVGQVIFTVENGSGAGTTSASKAEKTAAPHSPARAVPAPVTAGPAVQAPAKTAPANAAPAAPAPATPVSETPAKPAPAAAPQRERRATATSSVSTASEFRLPELGENIDSGDLVRLMISPGASVAEGRS